MPKETTCPWCKKVVAPGSAVADKEMNLLCCHCNKPIFGVTEEVETSIKAKFAEPVSSYSVTKREALPLRATDVGNEPLQSCYT